MPRLTTEAKRLRPLMFAIADAAIAGAAVNIIVYHFDGAPAEYFPVTDAGWDLAAAACDAYDTMVSPPALFTSAHTIPGTVMYCGAGDLSTLHSGTVTMSPGCYAQHFQVKIQADSADDIVALQGPASGQSWTNTVNIVAIQSGTGDATAFNAGAGDVNLYDTYMNAEAYNGGSAIGLKSISGGEIMAMGCEIYGTSIGGTAYGAYRSGVGDMYLYNCVVRGSTYTLNE